METTAPDLKDLRTKLRRDARSGDVAAMAALGRSLLGEPPYAPYDGIKITIEAAQKGSAEAAHLLAVLTACGAGLPQDWTASHNYLQHAARLGSPLAHQQLSLLNPDQVPAASGRNIPPHIAHWIETPPMRVVSQVPRIGVVEGFLAPQLCDWLVKRAGPLLKPAQVYDRATGEGRTEQARTNSTMDFSIVDSDIVVALVREKIARVSGLPTTAMEHSTVLHYRTGQQFFRHFDFLDPAEPGCAKDIAARGQRLFTFLVYLSDDFDGGETDFPQLQWRFKGRKGDAVFFWNVTPEGMIDRKTMHAGLAPVRGEKWLLSQWIRGRI